MKTKKHKIESIELIKFQKSFRKDYNNKYFYNIKLSDIEELLLLESEFRLDAIVIGKKVSYLLNEDNVVTNLIFE
jgi:hypothetical protein